MNPKHIDRHMGLHARAYVAELADKDGLSPADQQLLERAVHGHLNLRAGLGANSHYAPRSYDRDVSLYRIALLPDRSSTTPLAEIGKSLQVRRGDYLRMPTTDDIMFLDAHVPNDHDKRKSFYGALLKRADVELYVGATSLDVYDSNSNMAHRAAAWASAIARSATNESAELAFVEWDGAEFIEL